jgi:4a-hydroxytetrahydrobiopterin dehydratase
MNKLEQGKCRPLPARTPPLAQAKIDEYLKQVPGWEHRDGAICKTYSFRNFYETMAFVNTVAWIAHSEDHHPDMLVSYNKCKVAWNTHSVGGISMNDFICAAKIESLCRT